jgi:hypothetical protein
MFSNVYNSQDFDYMKSFLDTFFRSDMVVIFSKSGLGNEKKKEAECHGMDTCSQLWFESMHDAADLRFELLKSQIKLRTDGTGVVSSTFQMTGTKVITAMSNNNNQEPKLIETCEQTQTKRELLQLQCSSEQQSAVPSSFDQEFDQALNEYLQDDDQTTLSSSSSSTFTSSPCPPASVLPCDEEILNNSGRLMVNLDNLKESVDDYSCTKDMEEEVKRTAPTPSVHAIPFVCDGHLALHFDMDSKVYLVTYAILDHHFFPPPPMMKAISSF